jgi:hypothetical protein
MRDRAGGPRALVSSGMFPPDSRARAVRGLRHSRALPTISGFGGVEITSFPSRRPSGAYIIYKHLHERLVPLNLPTVKPLCLPQLLTR